MDNAAIKVGGKMLKIPELLFISCLGSYYYSIVQESQNDGFNPLLSYFAGSELKYYDKDIREIRNTKGENPWRYQPVEIMKEKETIEIDAKFIEFVSNELSIFTETVKATGEGLINNIISDYQRGFHCICKVDEFHIKHNKMFYQKESNRHYLLVKEIEYEKECFVVIDSETNVIYRVGFNEMEIF